MKTEQDLIAIAAQAITDFGGPGAMNPGTTHQLMGFLRSLASNERNAIHAFAAGMAQAQAQNAGIAARIDVDQCTAFMAALRDPDGAQPRFVSLASIELIVSAAMQQQAKTTTTNQHPFAAPYVKTLH